MSTVIDSMNIFILLWSLNLSRESCMHPSQVNKPMHCTVLLDIWLRWIHVQIMTFTITVTGIAKLKLCRSTQKKCLEQRALTRRLLPLEAAGTSKKAQVWFLLHTTLIRLHRAAVQIVRQNNDLGNTRDTFSRGFFLYRYFMSRTPDVNTDCKQETVTDNEGYCDYWESEHTMMWPGLK